MTNKTVCPLSCATGKYSICHSLCKFLNNNGECMLVLVLEKQLKN